MLLNNTKHKIINHLISLSSPWFIGGPVDQNQHQNKANKALKEWEKKDRKHSAGHQIGACLGVALVNLLLSRIVEVCRGLVALAKHQGECLEQL